jgi:hypothetical protein
MLISIEIDGSRLEIFHNNLADEGRRNAETAGKVVSAVEGGSAVVQRGNVTP